jgi:hypothetical protein
MSTSSRRELKGSENLCTVRKEIRKAAYAVYRVSAVSWVSRYSSPWELGRLWTVTPARSQFISVTVFTDGNTRCHQSAVSWEMKDEM